MDDLQCATCGGTARGHEAAVFVFASRRRHTRSLRDWSSDVCSSDRFGGSATLAARRTKWAVVPLVWCVPPERTTLQEGVALTALTRGQGRPPGRWPMAPIWGDRQPRLHPVGGRADR